MIAIETKHISKTYGDKKAVHDVSLAIRKGELFSLLGVNGAGKTTLIQMLSCLVKPTDGEGAILGCDLVKEAGQVDRKSTRLNSSHVAISYAVFWLKKKR